MLQNLATQKPCMVHSLKLHQSHTTDACLLNCGVAIAWAGDYTRDKFRRLFDWGQNIATKPARD